MQSHNIERSLKQIDDNLYSYMIVDEIADHFGYTRQHFSRQFKKEIGKSVAKQIENLKMIEAEKLLSSGKTTKQISELLCYANPSHFISVFKKNHNGLTPSEQKKK